MIPAFSVFFVGSDFYDYIITRKCVFFVKIRRKQPISLYNRAKIIDIQHLIGEMLNVDEKIYIFSDWFMAVIYIAVGDGFPVPPVRNMLDLFGLIYNFVRVC